MIFYGVCVIIKIVLYGIKKKKKNVHTILHNVNSFLDERIKFMRV